MGLVQLALDNRVEALKSLKTARNLGLDGVDDEMGKDAANKIKQLGEGEG